MGKYKFVAESLPNIPWEKCSEGSDKAIWRSTKNPIIPRDLLPTSNSIFNSAVVPYNGEFRGVFRCDDNRREMLIHSGKSKDGINWEINPIRLNFISENPDISEFEYGYDPQSS